MAHTERQGAVAANLMPNIGNHTSKSLQPRLDSVRLLSRQNQHKLIATHARHVVVGSAVFAQSFGHQLQYTVAFQMSEAIVDLFESVEVADQHRQGRSLAFAARQLGVKVQE